MSPRRVLTAGALTILVLSATPAAAAEPAITSGSCTATVDGTPGQQLTLSPAAVAAPIEQALAQRDPLGARTPAFPAQWAAMGPIPLGTVPDGQVQLTGATIADSVTRQLDRLPLLGPVLQTLVPTVHQTLSTVCGMLVRAVPPKNAPPAAPGPAVRPVAPANPGGPGSSVSGGPAPATRTGGEAVVFGSPLPGDVLFPLTVDGVPDTGLTVAGPPPPAVAAAAQTSGSAAALPVARDPLPTTALTALLLATLVSALLVRRWVLGGRHHGT